MDLLICIILYHKKEEGRFALEKKIPYSRQDAHLEHPEDDNV